MLKKAMDVSKVSAFLKNIFKSCQIADFIRNLEIGGGFLRKKKL